MRPLNASSVLAAALCVAALAIIAPLWAPLALAAWVADLLHPVVRRFDRLLGGRRRSAGALVVLVAMGLLVPLIGIVAALTPAIRNFLEQVGAAFEGRGSLAGAFLGGTDGGPPDTREWAELATRYAADAWRALAVLARASANAVIGVLVFVAAVYTFAVDGERAYAWFERHAPIPRPAFARLVGAFRETGRGLIVGGAGTALAQGALATAAYVAIGIPRALILGPLTVLCAIVPFVGTGLVWIPLAFELGMSGQYWRLAVVVVMGVGVHSLVDNFLRPVLTRYGRLSLPTFVVLVSMLGGIAVFGVTGALLGPIFVRLCVESLAIESERRAAEAASLTGAGIASSPSTAQSNDPPKGLA